MNKPVYCGQNLSIYPTYVVSMPYYEKSLLDDGPTRLKRSRFQRENEKNLKDNSTKGKVSRKAQTKIKNAVNWLLASAKPKRVYSKKTGRNWYFKINFITLTLPESHKEVKEAEFKRFLHAWIAAVRYSSGLKNYIWRLERQKNGRLHVHLVTDCFIHHKDVNKNWSRILNREGVSKMYHEKRTGVPYEFDYFRPDLIPQSTEVHTVKKVRNLGAYLAKYMTKNQDEDQQIKGKLWGCNRDLSTGNKLKLEILPCDLEAMNVFNKKEIRYKEITTKPNAFGSVHRLGDLYFLKPADWFAMKEGPIKDAYFNHMAKIRDRGDRIAFNQEFVIN